MTDEQLREWARMTREVLQDAMGEHTIGEGLALVNYLVKRAQGALEFKAGTKLGSMAGMLAMVLAEVLGERCPECGVFTDIDEDHVPGCKLAGEVENCDA